MKPAVLDHTEAASSLAIILASREPLLFLTSDQVVIAASSSFCRAFSIAPAHVIGRPLAELGKGEWRMPKLASLLKATAAGSAEIESYEIDLIRPGEPTRNLVIHAQVLADGETENVRLLLAVTDVTTARAEARLKDDLIRDKAILVQEVQHRIANSLQIIASVLMQGARRVQSEEARGYLQNAHHRVMSIAAVQRQLSVTAADEVILCDYLTQLCESLSASMIADPDRVTLKVTADDSVVSAGDSVSLGLIVTELVINALKHAFPDDRAGMISVDYASQDRGWTLAVVDDGIGIKTGPTAPASGLGTSIVQALARNLEAEVSIKDASPGTMVKITHRKTEGTGKDNRAPV